MNESISSHDRYSRGEELANCLIHGTGAALSVAALALLATMAGISGDPWRVVSFSIYGSCLLLLYLASTFYHAFRSPRLKQMFRVFDHTAIFLLIAGTYTPITLVILRGGWGWTLFGLIWGFAAAGIVLEIFFLDRIRWLTITTYVGMGWLVIIALKPLIEVMPIGALLWIGAGGMVYTTGVIFYVWKKLPFNHAIWHLFVLVGSSCHFFAFWLYIV